jgi:hypothetical protein
MSELTTELTDAELDAVCGGFGFQLINLPQTNINVQVPVAINLGSGSAMARAGSGLLNGIAL